MPPDGYPAFQYLQSVRVSKNAARAHRVTVRGSSDEAEWLATRSV